MFAIGALVAAGCATMTVSSHVEHAADFNRYHTFAWGPPDALPTGDARFDDNAFFRDDVQGAVDKELVTRGLVQDESGSPDLRIHYHANVMRRIDVDVADRQYGYFPGDRPPGAIEYEEGTLVVDVVEARTNKLVWRGWAQDILKLDDRYRLHRQVDEGVTQMFERFPLATRPLGVPSTHSR